MCLNKKMVNWNYTIATLKSWRNATTISNIGDMLLSYIFQHESTRKVRILLAFSYRLYCPSVDRYDALACRAGGHGRPHCAANRTRQGAAAPAACLCRQGRAWLAEQCVCRTPVARAGPEAAEQGSGGRHYRGSWGTCFVSAMARSVLFCFYQCLAEIDRSVLGSLACSTTIVLTRGSSCCQF